MIKDLEDADSHIQELRISMDNLEQENRILKNETRHLEDQLSKKGNLRPPSAGESSTAMLMIRKENE